MRFLKWDLKIVIMKKIITAVIAASAALFMASCGGSIDLNGKWEITTLNGEQVKAVETTPFIEFNTAEGKVHGHTSCNIMNGSYTQDGKKLTFSKMATTMMAGPDMELEGAVLDAINKTASVKNGSEGKILALDAEGNVLMELQKK